MPAQPTCICPGGDDICLGVPGDIDECLACFDQDPEFPCLNDPNDGLAAFLSVVSDSF